MSQHRAHYRIGELAGRTGVGVPTIRYYGEIGLLPAVGRGEGGQRIYDDTHVKRLQFIRRSRELGFSQDDVRTLLRYSDERGAPCAEVDRLAREQLDVVREKLASLKALEAALEEMIGACCNEVVDECSIIGALSGEAR